MVPTAFNNKVHVLYERLCERLSLSLCEWVTTSRTLTLGQIPIVFSIFTEIHRVYYLAASNAQNSHEMRKYCAAQLNAMAKEMLLFVHCFHFAYVPLDFFLVFGTTSLIFTPIPTRNFQDKKKFHLGWNQMKAKREKWICFCLYDGAAIHPFGIRRSDWFASELTHDPAFSMQMNMMLKWKRQNFKPKTISHLASGRIKQKNYFMIYVHVQCTAATLFTLAPSPHTPSILLITQQNRLPATNIATMAHTHKRVIQSFLLTL